MRGGSAPVCREDRGAGSGKLGFGLSLADAHCALDVAASDPAAGEHVVDVASEIDLSADTASAPGEHPVSVELKIDLPTYAGSPASEAKLSIALRECRGAAVMVASAHRTTVARHHRT